MKDLALNAATALLAVVLIATVAWVFHERKHFEPRVELVCETTEDRVGLNPERSATVTFCKPKEMIND